MSMKSKKGIKDLRNKFKSLLKEESNEEGIRHDAFILMSEYLSEIEKVQKQKDIKRNKLAELIEISSSYLTQVFRGDKPLNFYTIAKIQRALDIRFSVAVNPAPKQKIVRSKKK